MKKLLVCLMMMIPDWGTALAGSPVNKTFFGEVAIKGYDPVAYFTEGKPVRGVKEFTHEWRGAKWQFSTADNLQAFIKEPERFAPQYGGYCAYAVSEGYTADISPDAWRIVDHRLYLNYSKKVQKTWEQNIQQRIEQANKNWPSLRDGS